MRIEASRPPLYGPPRRWESPWSQWAALCVLSVAFVAPRLFHSGINVVTETYRIGCLRFFEGTNPYAVPVPHGDLFEYSPFFCLLYAPFAWLPAHWQALAWATFNAALFWAGVLSWVRVERTQLRWSLLAVALCSMELNISLLYQQINAFIIGFSLIALALLRGGHFFLAAFLLTMATNIKPIPAIFALPLLCFVDRSYWRGLLAGSVFVLLLPALFVGLSANVTWHQNWLLAIQHTLQLVRPAQHDIGTFFARLDLPLLGSILRYCLLAVGLMVLSSSVWLTRLRWPSWIILACATIILVSPRTESPTFVLLAPCYLLLLKIEDSPSLSTYAVLLLSGFLLTFVYTDAWPHAWLAGLRVDYVSKTLGALLLWSYSLWHCLRQLGHFPQEEALFLGRRESV